MRKIFRRDMDADIVVARRGRLVVVVLRNGISAIEAERLIGQFAAERPTTKPRVLVVKSEGERSA